MGYSLGGGVALQTAIRHPEVVRKLVVVSTPCKRDGWYPEILAGMAQMGPEAAEPMKQSPMYQLYAAIAPRPQDWPVLLTKMGRLLRQDYDWSQDVAAIKAPTMIVVGDADTVRTAHAVEMFELLGGGQGRRRMGRLRHVQCPARHPAGHDALQHLLFPHAGIHCQAVSWTRRCASRRLQ